jgi:NUMOD3 motif
VLNDPIFYVIIVDTISTIIFMTKSTKTNHYTYIIRHTNGKYYVGRHSSKKDPLLDPYMGSGKWVKSIKDRSTLIKTIIAYYDTFEELKVAEMELIEKYFDDVYCMNATYSSEGAASGNKHHNFGKSGELCPTNGDKNGMYGRTGDKHPMYGRRGELSHMYGTTHSEETKKKISESNSGVKNHMYGKTGELSLIYGKNNPNYGKIGDKNHNYGKTGELCPNYGRIHTDKAKKKISDAISGENNPRASITDHIAKLIKIRIAEGFKNKQIAEEFNTTESVVNKIRHNKSWKHITIN